STSPVIRFGCFNRFHLSEGMEFSAFIVKRFRVFRAPLHSSIGGEWSFRIYRETLSRFSCAASTARSEAIRPSLATMRAAGCGPPSSEAIRPSP
ncbi:hypothetical protein ABLN67_21890, partial [Mycobacterium tuberculosis]